MDNSLDNPEIKRIKKAYQSYNENQVQTRWSADNLGNQAILHERLQFEKAFLESYGSLSLDQLRVLDVGCGAGSELARFLEWGAKPENLYGVDLLPDRIETARRNYPELHFECANAEHLDFPDAYFDLLLLFTVFSSILDESMAHNVAKEVCRVLKDPDLESRKPGGVVLWYDFRYNNPWNPHTRRMTRQYIRQFFPDFKLRLRAITLLPPVARRLGDLTPLLYPLLAFVPFLRTHYLGLLVKSKED